MKEEIIKINDVDYKFKIGFGVILEYEDVEDKPFTAIKKRKDLAKLIYIALQYNNDNFKYSFKEFCDDILDENPQLFLQLVNLTTSFLFNKKEKDTNEDTKKK